MSASGEFIAGHPDDPLGYSVKAAGYLFGELDRLGILESEFFQSDHKIAEDKKKLRPDPAAREGFYAAIERAQSLTAGRDDAHSIFALCMALGEQVDYMALIEKRQLASLSVNKRGYREAKRLLAIDPSYIDAYLATGFTEYMVGSLPVFVRWFAKFDDVEGSKQQGMRTVERVARDGHYFRPFAKILLATAYLREKNRDEAKKLLAELTTEFPANPLLKREYEKLR